MEDGGWAVLFFLISIFGLGVVVGASFDLKNDFMWKTKNKLFGWHYIAYEYGYSHSVKRVRKLRKKRYVINNNEMIFIKKDGRTESGGNYIPLTFDLQ